MKENFAIIGGGIAGLTAAIALQQKGYIVKIFESALALRKEGGGLVLAVNAIISLRKLGIENAVSSAGNEMPVFKVLDSDGLIINDMEDDFMMKTFEIKSLAISRNALHQALLSQVNGDCLTTGKRAINVIQSANGVHIQFEDGTSHDCTYLVVADGVHSLIRQKLIPGSKPRYAGYTCWRAVIDNVAKADLPHGFEAVGKEGRCGMTPLPNNKVYWFAVANAPRNSTEMKNMGANALLERFKNYPEPIPSILRQTKDKDIVWSDIIDITPIPKFAFGNLLLMGDAAHATTPKMAQGACQAIEDAAVLAHILENKQHIPAAFREFERRRLKRTHRIVNGSWILGKVYQTENPFLISLRNFVFRRIPKSVMAKQLQQLYSVDF